MVGAHAAAEPAATFDSAESVLVATAVACWVWEQSMALLQKSNAAPNPLVSKGWTPRAHM